jgi:geranylgeranyl diphosphate synthase type I
MTAESLIARQLNAIEAELHHAVDRSEENGLAEFDAMLAYHLGWEGPDGGPEARGKRIRPLLVVLACAAGCGAWEQALPAAAAVELVHNFSLIHDDIQDNSPLRRGRETVWVRWGIPQAINAGDAMLTLAHLEVLRLGQTCSPDITLLAANILQNACLQLTKGQFLDMAYEDLSNLSLELYWQMVSGKTAALLAACTELGALVASAPLDCRAAYRDFGRYLGLAFQAQDDILGIWGDSALTGKSAESDLLEGKKSLPILYGLNRSQAFARRWKEGRIRPDEVADLASQLEAEGARAYTEQAAREMTDKAILALNQAKPAGEADRELRVLADSLLKRRG